MNQFSIMRWAPPVDTSCHSLRNVGDEWYGNDVSGKRQDPRAARALCAPCGYQAECLAAALRFECGKPADERWGVWGGTVPAERARIEAGDVAWPESAA